MTIKVSEMTAQQKMGNTGAAPSASRNWDFAYTWDSGGTTFTADFMNITDTASAAGSLVFERQVGGAVKASITKAGVMTLAGRLDMVVGLPGYGIIYDGGVCSYLGSSSYCRMAVAGFTTGSGGVYGWGNATTIGGAPTIDTATGRASSNSIVSSATGVAASTTSRTELNKLVTGIANAAATAVLTITIPNAAHSGQVYVEVCGSLGAGGAIGANEATATNCYTITLTRTAGVNAVAAISTGSGAGAVAVAGAATVTCTAALSAVSGAVGATNTFTVNVTISRSGGSSANHTCLVYAKQMNANETGMTIA